MSTDLQTEDERQKMFRQMPFHSEENITFNPTVKHRMLLGKPVRQPMHQKLQTKHPTSRTALSGSVASQISTEARNGC